MYILARNAAATKSMKPVVAALIIYSVVFGLRYGVGRDFFTYSENYLDIQSGLNPSQDFESGFALLTSLMARSGLPPCFYFGVIAFIQIIFLFYAEKDNKNIYPLLVFTFIFSTTWLTYSNTLRQNIVFCFYVFALKLIEDKKIWQHYLLILIGFFIHKSAILLLMAYPAFLLVTKPKKKMQNSKPKRKKCHPAWGTAFKLMLLPFALVLGRTSFLTGYLEIMDKILLLAGYGDYVNYADFHKFVLADGEAKSIGIGFVVIFAINFMQILCARRTTSFWHSRRVSFISLSFFIGAIFHYLFQSSQLIGRINIYFYGFGFIFGAYTLYQLKKRGQQWPYLILISLYLLLFVGYLHSMDSNTTAFYFLWQANSYPI